MVNGDEGCLIAFGTKAQLLEVRALVSNVRAALL